MDRALKERTIGAVVLVVFVVLVVPIFLDGPPTESEIVSEQVRLPGQGEQASKTVVLDRERSTPIPAARGANEGVDRGDVDRSDEAPAESPAVTAGEVPAAGTDEPPEPSRPATTTTPAPAEQQAVAVPAAADQSEAAGASEASTTGMWAVQLGSFQSRDNAEALAAKLRAEGYAAFLSQRMTAAGPMHRVRIGPQADRDAAEKTAARLAREGHSGQVVPHP